MDFIVIFDIVERYHMMEAVKKMEIDNIPK